MEPKSYQVELYEKAKLNDVIIKLNTGSGKTFIASMLIKEKLSVIGDKKIFFLVKNASLAQQHTCYLRQYLFLDKEIGFFHGNMNNSWVDFWSKDKWAEEITKHKIIIMTAKVFLDILNHNKYSLDSICLLIFDEVHHMAKLDDYAQISEHLTTDVNHVKILGLTACLIKNIKKRQEIDFLIDEMEMKLHCNVITSMDSIANDFSTKIVNVFIDYVETETDDLCSLTEILDSSLRKIMDIDEKEEPSSVVNRDNLIVEENAFMATKRHIREILSVLNSIGIIACNSIVDLFLKDIPTLMNEIHISEERNQDILKEFQRCLSRLNKKLVTIIKRSTQLNCSTKTTKLLKLILDLKKTEKVSEDNFILIFVTERIQALALNEMFCLLPTINDKFSFIKSEFIIGHSTCRYPKKMEMNGQVQHRILNRFRDRQFNILIATNVVEEGLDIPHCNVVIKFDPPVEFRSYLQSKGRARAQDSQYVVFVKSKDLGPVELRLSFYDQVNRAINESLKSRAIDKDNSDSESDDDGDNDPSKSEPKRSDYMPYGKSGPRITLNSASGVLCRYIGKLRCNSLCDIKIRYTFEQNHAKFYQTTLLLPMPSPYLEEIKGGFHINKRISRRHANLEACKILHGLDELDRNLLPYNRYDEEDEIISPKERGAGETARYEKYIAQALRSEYQKLSELTNVLYLYSIRYTPQVFLKLGFEDFSAFDMSSSIGFLLPKPIKDMKTIANFPIYLVGGKCFAKIVFEKEINVTAKKLSSLLKCHELLFKLYAQRMRKFRQNISYSPTESKCPLIITILKNYKIDFTAIAEVLSKEFVVKLSENPQSSWVGSVIRPTYLSKEFGAYIVTKVSMDLNCCSKMKFLDTEYREYYEKKYQVTVSEEESRQPLVFVKRLTTIQSCINKEKRSLKDSRRLQEINLRETLFVPSLTECISLSSSVWTHLCIFPTIHFRLNQILSLQDFIATLDMMELSKSHDFVDVDFDECNNIKNIESSDMYQDENSFLSNIFSCFVAKKCNDRMDLEQYEILGDSFLKFVTTKYLYHFSLPTDNEGKLTQRRTKLISNRYLFQLAQAKELSNYLSFINFDPKTNYLPPNFIVICDESNPRDRNDREFVSYKSKCLADCVEALIGSIFTNYGHLYAVKFLLWMNMTLIPSDYSGDKFDILAAPPTIFCRTNNCDPEIPECISDLEKILDYTFKHKAYAVQAITHPTSQNRDFSCYQRLEYLGDAVLDFLVTSYIMVKNPKMKPGNITNLRSAIVNNNTFAFLSAKWEFHKFLRYFDMKMFFALPDVVEELIENNLNMDALFLKKSEHFKVIVKVLGDIFESIAGAIFVDSDYSLDAVWAVYKRLMEDPLKRFQHHIPKNKITLLHEKFPNLKCTYEVEAGTNIMILTASFQDGTQIQTKETNKLLCKLSLAQELKI